MYFQTSRPPPASPPSPAPTPTATTLPATTPPASIETSSKSDFKLVNTTKEAEDAFDLVELRKPLLQKPIGTVATIAHLMKSALGSGILSGHVAFMKAGVMVAVPVTVLIGFYLFYCISILGNTSRIICKRTARPIMSYSDLGEAAVATFPNKTVQKLCKPFRYYIDFLIMFELFGACATYQLIIARTLKQLIDDIPGIEVNLSVRAYVAIMLLPCVAICMLRHLQWLAPFSIVANCLIAFCVGVTIYYSFQNNPRFENLVSATGITGAFELMGMIVFGMSCASQSISVENNMKDPYKFSVALSVGMVLIVGCVVTASFFGYVAYTDKSLAPITLNYPMTLFPKILKCLIAFMIFITHALNYFFPFVRLFSYLSKLHNPEDPKYMVYWEYFYRFLCVTIIGIIAIVFPDITGLMGFLGCFSLSNIAFVFPIILELLTVWTNPGLGAMKWRLWKAVFLLIIGLLLWACGSVIGARSLVTTFSKS